MSKPARQALAMLRKRRGWLLGLLLLCAGCTAAGPHAQAINAVDEDEVVEAAEKDTFPSAHAPAN